MPCSDKTSTKSSDTNNNITADGRAMLSIEATASPPPASIVGILNRRTTSSPSTTSAFTAPPPPISSSSSGTNTDHEGQRLKFKIQQEEKKKNRNTNESSCFPESQPKLSFHLPLKDILKKAVKNLSCLNHNQDQSNNLGDYDDRHKYNNLNVIAAALDSSRPTNSRLGKYIPPTLKAAAGNNSNGKEVANSHHNTFHYSPYEACEMQFTMELEESKPSLTTTTTSTTHHDEPTSENQEYDAIIAHTCTINSNGSAQEPEQDDGLLCNPQLQVTDDDNNSDHSHDAIATGEDWVEESDALLAVALHNYEMFHSWKLGTAGVADLEISSAGVAGWASASFTVTTTVPSPSPDNDDRSVTTAATARKKCDEEEDMQLRVALLQSLGVEADCTAYLSSQKIIHELQESNDGHSFDDDGDVVRDEHNFKDATREIEEESDDDDYTHEEDYEYDDDEYEQDNDVDVNLFKSDSDDDEEKDDCKNHTTFETSRKVVTKDSIKYNSVTDDKEEEEVSVKNDRNGKKGSISSASEHSDSESYDLIDDVEKGLCDTSAAAKAATSNACADNDGTNVCHEQDNKEESSGEGYYVVESHLHYNARSVPASVVVSASDTPTVADTQTTTTSTPMNRNKQPSAAPKVNCSSWQFQSFMKHVAQTSASEKAPVKKSSTASNGKTSASSRSSATDHLSSNKNNDDSSSGSEWSLIDKDD